MAECTEKITGALENLYVIEDTNVPEGAHVIDKDKNLFSVHYEGETHFGCTDCDMDGYTCLGNPCGTSERDDGLGIYYKEVV